MARARNKEVKKSNPEERALERWNQHVFFINKQFPESAEVIHSIRQKHENGDAEEFVPTEEAVTELESVLGDLRATQQLPNQASAS